MKASVLAVGTELVIGQTHNKNAAWISQQLRAVGLLTSVHLTVPDERPLILKGLEFCASQSEIIFVTGGLGPTSDDFTRDLISEWAGLSLQFDLSSWQRVQEIMTQKGLPIQEFQKQQCYFPQGAKIHINLSGTANGFQLRAHNKELWALPGPPREIESLWNSAIGAWIQTISETVDRQQTWSWNTSGYGESQVMQKTELALQGWREAGIPMEIGYRVHGPKIQRQSEVGEIPGTSHGTQFAASNGNEVVASKNFVEVKVSCFESQRAQVEPWIHRLEIALRPLTV